MRTALGVILALLLVLAVILTVKVKEVHAAPVTLDMTLPLFYTTGDCFTASPDTVKGLASLTVYSSTNLAVTDSVAVFTGNVAGLFGKPFSVTVDQPLRTIRYYWCVTRDSLQARACRSNVTAKSLLGGPPRAVTDLRGR